MVAARDLDHHHISAMMGYRMLLLRSREVPCMLRMQEIEATQLFMFNFMCMIYPCTINVRASDAFGLVYHCDRGIENMNITTLIEPFD